MYMKKYFGYKLNQLGFTLVELLIVIIIIGILIALGAGSFSSSQKKSRDSQRKNDLRQIGLSLELYFADHGRYPESNSEGEIMGCAPLGTDVCEWGAIFQSEAGGATYMVELPREKTVTKRYFYVSDPAAGLWYQIFSRLENKLDSDIPKNPQDESQVFTDLDCANGVAPINCNYGIASTNISASEGHTVAYE